MAPGLGHTIRPVAAHVEAGQGHTRMDPQGQIRLLQIELAKVRQEASTLRKRLGKNGYHARRIERAAEDALLLAVIRLAEVLPSRRLASSLGIPEGRYGHALALLRLARIVTRQRHWATTDIATIESRIVAPADRLWKTPKPFFLVTVDAVLGGENRKVKHRTEL